MNSENARPQKIVMLELAIYVIFLMAYVYLKRFMSVDWLQELYRQIPAGEIFAGLGAINVDIAIVLGLLVLALILFAYETISVDIITVILLIALVVTNILTPEEAFAGFSNEIIIILVSIFVISSALQQTGVMDAAGVYLLKIAGKSPSRLLPVMMGAAGGVSMFMNNTTATAVFISPTLKVARQAGLSPSKLLIPLAYASILGGTATLIGTSTNVAISGYIVQLGLEPLTLFELTPLGLIILGTGILYMLTVGRRLLPDYKQDDLTEGYAIREYLSEVIVMPESSLVGQKIFESQLAEMDFRILGVVRNDRKFRPNSRSRIEEGDILLVQGKVDELIKVRETAGIEIKPELKWEETEWQTNGDSEAVQLGEVLIIPRSDLIGRTLKSAQFQQRYGVTALAIYRHGHSLRDKIGRIRLRLGDVLLVQGSTERFDYLRRSPDFWILEELNPLQYRKRKGLVTVALLGIAILVGGLGWLPLSIALLAAAVLIILTGCITIEEAYEFIDWRLIVLIGGMTAFGVAMEKSGTAEFLADWVVFGLEPFGVLAVMAGFSLLTIALTQPMSNAAAALVVLPVALTAAQRLGVNERTFAITIMLAASISLIAPFEPASILVYGPGKYKFIDFVKTGAGLTIILTAIILFLIPVFWPL